MSQILFTSDLHFGHEHLLQYQRQEFGSAAEMDVALIEGWRNAVGRKDTVYLLGDVSFHRPAATAAILEQLPGHKILVRGNHDKSVDKPALRKHFDRIEDMLEIKVPDPDAYEKRQRIVLCHYPMVTWSASRYGSWMLHGHCHANLREDLLPKAKRLDIGVDSAFKMGLGYRPFTYDEVKAFMKARVMKTVDHHRPKDWEHEEA